jgi:hypothetical protein
MVKNLLFFLIIKIFKFFLFSDFPPDSSAHFNSCLYIGDESINTKYLSINVIDELLLKRLQITRITETMIRKRPIDSKRDVDLVERRQFFYLFNSIKRLKMLKDRVDVSTYDFLFELCINMSKTVIELNMEDNEIIKNLCLQLIDLINHCLEESGEGMKNF